MKGRVDFEDWEGRTIVHRRKRHLAEASTRSHLLPADRDPSCNIISTVVSCPSDKTRVDGPRLGKRLWEDQLAPSNPVGLSSWQLWPASPASRGLACKRASWSRSGRAGCSPDHAPRSWPQSVAEKRPTV